MKKSKYSTIEAKSISGYKKESWVVIHNQDELIEGEIK